MCIWAYPRLHEPYLPGRERRREPWPRPRRGGEGAKVRAAVANVIGYLSNWRAPIPLRYPLRRQSYCPSVYRIGHRAFHISSHTSNMSHHIPHLSNPTFQLAACTREAWFQGEYVLRTVLYCSSIPLPPSIHDQLYNTTQFLDRRSPSESTSIPSHIQYLAYHRIEFTTTSTTLEHSPKRRVRGLSISEIRITRSFGSPSQRLLPPARGALADFPT